jgi:hypothetical protein
VAVRRGLGSGLPGDVFLSDAKDRLIVEALFSGHVLRDRGDEGHDGGSDAASWEWEMGGVGKGNEERKRRKERKGVKEADGVGE